MKKTASAIFMIVFLAALTTFALAQSPEQSGQEARPGPGYGMGQGPMGPGPGYGVGPDYGPGYGRGMGPGVAGPGYGMRNPGPGYWNYNMMGGGWGIFMIVFMVIFLVLSIAGIVLLVRYLSPHSRLKPSEDALEILKRRYARGEIQKAEFEEKRKDLQS